MSISEITILWRKLPVMVSETLTISYCRKIQVGNAFHFSAFYLLLFLTWVLHYLYFIGFHLDTEETKNLLPGFLDSILGVRQGETKIFNLLFPESWEQENLQGVNAGFTVSHHVVLLSTWIFFESYMTIIKQFIFILIIGCVQRDIL